ncbi:MAG: AAA family ATPase [Christensenellaceae bacterium]|jgi:predicted ATPase|nr:AAA family ATPase [Christensenellaceae bacterium]
MQGFKFKFEKSVTIFAGENAAGKSTLLESLAVRCGFPAQGGRRGQNMLLINWERPPRGYFFVQSI